MNKGGSQEIAGLRVTMTDARHSSGFFDNGQMVYMGEAAGFIVRLEDGRAIYYAGDTCLFGDMRLIGEMYKPDIAFLPIGDRFTMDPVAAAKRVRMARCAPGRADALGHVSAPDWNTEPSSSASSKPIGRRCPRIEARAETAIGGVGESDLRERWR